MKNTAVFCAAIFFTIGLTSQVPVASAGPNGTYWDGSITIYSAPDGCGFLNKVSYKSALRPAGLENNSPNKTYFSIYSHRGAASIVLPANKSKGKYTVDGVSTRGHPYVISAKSQKFSGYKTSPGAIQGDTEWVHLDIVLKNFQGRSECDMVLKGAYVANPGN